MFELILHVLVCKIEFKWGSAFFCIYEILHPQGPRGGGGPAGETLPVLGHILGQAWLRGAQGQHAQGEPHEEPLLWAQQQGDILGEAITVGQIEN